MNEYEKDRKLMELGAEIINLENKLVEAKATADMIQRMINKKQERYAAIKRGEDLDQSHAWGEDDDTVFDENYQAFPVEH
jgi:hypothetical protein